MPKSSDICSCREMQTHQHASLIYYSLLWPKSVRSCDSDFSRACIRRGTRTQTPRLIKGARQGERRFCFRPRQHRFLLSCFEPLLCEETSNSLTELRKEATVSPERQNLASCIIQPERFNRQALGDLAGGQGNTTQPAGPESICIRSVYAFVYM